MAGLVTRMATGNSPQAWRLRGRSVATARKRELADRTFYLAPNFGDTMTHRGTGRAIARPGKARTLDLRPEPENGGRGRKSGSNLAVC